MLEDFRIEIKEIIGVDDSHVLVAVRDGGRVRGSDAEIFQLFFHVWTFSEGKIIRESIHTDRHRALEVAGLSE
jgi:ketosteroid isomerase-like protein